MQVVVDDLLTSYELQGKGTLVLLLHGWGDSSKGHHQLIGELSKKYQVLAPDLPGFGASQAPKSVWGLEDYAQFLAHLLRKLELKQPYAVIGHSNGGALAIKASSQSVLQSEKIVLMAASGIRNKQTGKRLLLNILAKTGNIATLWMPERYRQALRKSLYQTAGSDFLVVPALQETFKKTVRQDVQADARKLSQACLLIYAENDNDVPLADGRRYADLIPKAQLEVIRDAGHFVHLDKPQVVAKLIQDFLA